jgi:hypothetical protein
VKNHAMNRFGFVAVLCGAILVNLNFSPRGFVAQAAGTPTPYVITTTMPTAAQASCGPLFTSPNATLYCAQISYTAAPITCSTAAPQNISIAGGNVAVPMPTGTPTAYEATAGLGTQFLPVTWGGSSTSGYLYVTSLVAGLSFTLLVHC